MYDERRYQIKFSVDKNALSGGTGERTSYASKSETGGSTSLIFSVRQLAVGKNHPVSQSRHLDKTEQPTAISNSEGALMPFWRAQALLAGIVPSFSYS